MTFRQLVHQSMVLAWECCLGASGGEGDRRPAAQIARLTRAVEENVKELIQCERDYEQYLPEKERIDEVFRKLEMGEDGPPHRIPCIDLC